MTNSRFESKCGTSFWAEGEKRAHGACKKVEKRVVETCGVTGNSKKSFFPHARIVAVRPRDPIRWLESASA